MICTCGADRRSPCPVVVIDDRDGGVRRTLGVPVSPTIGIFDDQGTTGGNGTPTIVYDERTHRFQVSGPNVFPGLDLNGGGTTISGVRLFGDGPTASDFLGQTLPFVRLDQPAPAILAPSSALTITFDGGRAVVRDDYRATVEAGQRALTRIQEIRRMSQDTSTNPETMSSALAEIPALLAIYRRAAERVREVHTKSGMNPYATIDAWANRYYQGDSSVLEGVMVGFNMQGLNSRDTTYQSGTAVKELVAYFGPTVAAEMGLTNVERLGTWGTNAAFAGVPADRAQDFMNRLRQRIVEFLNGNHPFPNAEMARRIGCQGTGDLRIRTWTPELLGMTGGYASISVPEGARPAAVTQRIIEALTLMANRARYAEAHPAEATQGFYAGDIPAAEQSRGTEPLLIATRAAQGEPFDVNELVRGGITEADIAQGLLPRPGHDAGYSIAHARALETFFQSVGNPPTVEALRARAPELRVIIDAPQLYLFVQSTRNAQGEFNAGIISRVTGNAEQASQLTALLRSAVNADGTWNWSRITENQSDILSKMSPPAVAELHNRSAADMLDHIYDISLRDYRFPDFYRPEAFPQAVEHFLNGSEGIVQMIDLKNFYSMKLELGDTRDAAMRAITDLIRQTYAERGIDVIIAKRGDEFYVCMRGRTRTGERVDAAMVDGLNHTLTDGIRTTFENTVLPQMDKYPGDMAGIHSDEPLRFSVESLTTTGPDGHPTEQPGVVIRDQPRSAIEYVIVGNEVYVTQQPSNMDSFAETVGAASQAGLGRSVDPRNGHLHVVGSFKEVPDTRGQRRTQRYVQLQTNAETGEQHPVIVMMPGGEPPHAQDTMRGGIDVGATISGGVRVNETTTNQGEVLGLALDGIGDSTSEQKSPLGLDLLPTDPVRSLVPWEATLTPRGRFAFGAVSFGLPGLGMRVYHDGVGALIQGSTYTGLARDYASMSFGSAMMEPVGNRVAGLLRSRSSLFGHGFGLVGGTIVMSIVSTNGRASVADISANIVAAGVGLAGAAAVMRCLRFLSGATSLAGGPARALLRAIIEAALIDGAGNIINWGRNQYAGSQLRSAYVTAFRNFDQAVVDARTAGPNAPDRDARLQLVRTRAQELGQAFNHYLPFLQMNHSDEGDEYTRAYLAVQNAQDDVVQEHRAPMLGETGDSLFFVYSADAHEQRETAMRDSQARLDRADRRLREGFERAVTSAGAHPPPFIPFQTVRDSSAYDSALSDDGAALFVQHSNNVMLRLQSLGIPTADMPTYVAALMGRSEGTTTH